MHSTVEACFSHRCSERVCAIDNDNNGAVTFECFGLLIERGKPNNRGKTPLVRGLMGAKTMTGAEKTEYSSTVRVSKQTHTEQLIDRAATCDIHLADNASKISAAERTVRSASNVRGAG